MWALEYRAEKDGSNTLPSDMSVLPPWVRDALAGSPLLTKYRKNDHLNYIHTLYLAIRAPDECDVEADDFSEQLEKYIAKKCLQKCHAVRKRVMREPPLSSPKRGFQD